MVSSIPNPQPDENGRRYDELENAALPVRPGEGFDPRKEAARIGSLRR